MSANKNQLYRNAAGAKLSKGSLQNPANNGSSLPVPMFANGGRTDIPLQKKAGGGAPPPIQGVNINRPIMPQRPIQPGAMTGMPSLVPTAPMVAPAAPVMPQMPVASPYPMVAPMPRPAMAAPGGMVAPGAPQIPSWMQRPIPQVPAMPVQGGIIQPSMIPGRMTR